MGIDPSKNMLKAAKERGIQVIQGVGEELPFKDCTFNFVLIVVTLCFVKNPEYMLVEAGRVLKSGGRLIVGDINKDIQLGRLYEAKKEKSAFYKIATFYSGNEIIGMFDEVGIRYLESYQTLLQPLAFPEIEEAPEKDIWFVRCAEYWNRRNYRGRYLCSNWYSSRSCRSCAALILTHRRRHFCIHSLEFCRAGSFYPERRGWL